MGSSGDAIPSEPARQVTAEDNAERDKREAEKNATKASLNLQATAGPAAVPTASKFWLTTAALALLFANTDAYMLQLQRQNSTCNHRIRASPAHAAGKEPLETAQAEAGPKNYQAPAFDAPDSGNPKKITPILESEAEFVRYKRQRTV